MEMVDFQEMPLWVLALPFPFLTQAKFSLLILAMFASVILLPTPLFRLSQGQGSQVSQVMQAQPP
jgi:hypothetical protein